MRILSTLIYDARGFLVQATDELGRVTQYTTDDLGRITAITDPAGDTTNFSYDALDRLLTSTNSLNHVTEYAYDSADRLLRVTVSNGAQETYQYDGYGRQTSMTRYNGGVSLMTYRLDNLPATQTNPAGTVTQFQYDQSKRLIQTNTGGLQTTYWSIRGQSEILRGFLVQATDELGRVTQYTTDDLGRITAITDPAGDTTNFSYDALDRLLTSTKENRGKSGSECEFPDWGVIGKAAWDATSSNDCECGN